MNTARNCEMANIITAIDISDSNNYILEIPIEGKTVEFGDDSDIVYKMNCVKAILEKEKNVHAGGSGPVCSALIDFGYIYKLMKEKKLKKVLIVPTGAIFSPTMVFQRQTIPSIAHAISLEAI